MVLRGAWIAVLVLCSARGARAEVTRWQSGPALNVGQNPVSVWLYDGRLLTCTSQDAKPGCEIVDPATGERRSVPIAGGSLDGALGLDDGKLLLGSGAVLDPETGTSEAIPVPAFDPRRAQSAAVTGGRAVFWSGTADAANCHRLEVFFGVKRGFRVFEAARPGVCVGGVFDIGGRELLVTRVPPSDSGRGKDVEFLLLNLDSERWQRGARLPERTPRAVLRFGSELLVLAENPSSSSFEAVFLDQLANSPRITTFAQKNLRLEATRRHGFGAFLLFDERGAYRWEPDDARIAHLPLVAAPRAARPRVVERGDVVVLIDTEASYPTSVLRRPAGPALPTPCDEAFAYAERAMSADAGAGAIDPELLLKHAGDSPACFEWLDTQERFPDSIQVPLEALVSAPPRVATSGEQVAATVLCTLIPRFGVAWIPRVLPLLERWRGREHCEAAREQLPVFAALGRGTGASAALAEAGFPPGHSNLREWVLPAMRTRKRFRRAAGALLLAAHQRRVYGFDRLWISLCLPEPEPELVAPCAHSERGREADWRAEDAASHRSSRRREAITRLAVATGVIGGLGSIAYFDRQGEGGRLVAIGSGVAAGSVLGVGLAFVSARGRGDTSGLGAVLLAVPLSIAGGVAGGIAAGVLSREPGDARFATAAVPLSVAYAITIGHTIDAW